MSQVSVSYPHDFPANVPPNDAKPANGIAYRLVRNIPPLKEDFCGYYKEPYLKCRPKNPKPNFFGTSMFRDYQETEIARELHKPQREKKIVVGELNPSHGVISKENKNTHFDAWVAENTCIQDMFNVVSN
jgi:hypothetical protein